MKRILLDTGPLVGLLSPADSHHKAAITAWKEVVPPLYTCWPVLTEAAWLLRAHPAAVERMLASAAGGLFRILQLDETDASAVAEIHKRHRKLRPADPGDPEPETHHYRGGPRQRDSHR